MVLGGYGFFGERICDALVQIPGITLFVAGRDADKAKKLAARLGIPTEHAVQVDVHAKELTEILVDHGIATVINTVGPFQQQKYEVPVSAIMADAITSILPTVESSSWASPNLTNVRAKRE